MTESASLQIQVWPIDKLVFYARYPRKNDAAVDRMRSSIREYGFKVPCLARSDGEVVDGHLRLKAARKGVSEVQVILRDEWTPAQVKAFRLMVNRSVTWADWDEELLLALELQDLSIASTSFSCSTRQTVGRLEPKEKAPTDFLIHPGPRIIRAVSNLVSRPGSPDLNWPEGLTTNRANTDRLLGPIYLIYLDLRSVKG